MASLLKLSALIASGLMFAVPSLLEASCRNSLSLDEDLRAQIKSVDLPDEVRSQVIAHSKALLDFGRFLDWSRSNRFDENSTNLFLGLWVSGGNYLSFTDTHGLHHPEDLVRDRLGVDGNTAAWLVVEASSLVDFLQQQPDINIFFFVPPHVWEYQQSRGLLSFTTREFRAIVSEMDLLRRTTFVFGAYALERGSFDLRMDNP